MNGRWFLRFLGVDRDGESLYSIRDSENVETTQLAFSTEQAYARLAELNRAFHF